MAALGDGDRRRSRLFHCRNMHLIGSHDRPSEPPLRTPPPIRIRRSNSIVLQILPDSRLDTQFVSSNSTIRFFIDEPVDWDRLSCGVIIRGWCYCADGTDISAIQLRHPGHTIAGAVRLPRPDVAELHGEGAARDTGFEVRTIVPPGRHHIQLVALLGGGGVETLVDREVTVRGRLIPRWLGGGSRRELIAFQMPAHSAHAPRPLRPEQFPLPRPHARSGPRFSIVTPSYNQAVFIEQAIQSVLEQDCPVDYVIRDGGSIDGTAEILRRLDGKLRNWKSEKDPGQAHAIQDGFLATSGGPDDIMAWLNSDDIYVSGALPFVRDYFSSNPDVDVVYGHRILIDERGREIGRWFLPRHDPAVLRLNDFIPQETMFWRRRIWDKVGGIDTSLRFAMDWDLLLRFQRAGAVIVRLPYFLACFRIHSLQKTSSAIHTVGQLEIESLRARENGGRIEHADLMNDPRLIRYLRRSAWIEWLWKLGIRAG